MTLAEAAAAQAASFGLADEVLSVADAMDAQHLLRRSLSEPNTDVAQRQHLADALFGDSLSPAALDLVRAAAGQGWPSAEAMAFGLRDAAVSLTWRAAASSAETARGQLLALIRAVTTSVPVNTAIGDASHDAESRRALALALVPDAGPAVELLVRSAISDSRETFAGNLSAYLDCLARLRGHIRAAVTTAVAMTASQVDTLMSQLSRIYGAPIDLEPAIDPSVIGGVRVNAGDDVIDGSIKSRLDAAREAMRGNQVSADDDEKPSDGQEG